jgi:hypothetical protein
MHQSVPSGYSKASSVTVSSFLSEAICTHRMQSLLKFMEVDLSVFSGNSEMLLFMGTVFYIIVGI